MEKEIYTPMERILIEGANRLEHNHNLMLLLDYELEQYMKRLEEEAAGKEECVL